MSLCIDKDVVSVNPYLTNLYYLQNMTKLQMKALNEIDYGMRWDIRLMDAFEYIHINLNSVPYVLGDEKENGYEDTLYRIFSL